MNGHPTPRRRAVWLHLLPSRQRSQSLVSLLLALLLLAVMLGASLAAASCGSGTDSTAESTPTTDAATTSAAAAAPDATQSDSATTDTTQPAAVTFPVTLTDDNGASVTVPAEPMRIVSTAPAITETLFALGVGDRVVGVTSLCDYPAEVAGITKVGDFQANTEAIMALSPDMVLGYSGNEEALAPIQAAGAPVLIFNPATLDGVLANIITIGAATGATAEAAQLVETIQAELEEATQAATATSDKPRVFYALDNTLWTCGPGSFVDEMLSLANCVNIGSAETPAGAASQAYYQFTPEQLVAADPDVILLPGSSGYKSADEFTADPRFAGLTAVKEGHVYLFDDTTVTRPGARIGEGLKVLVEAIHPGAL
jgi:iron complex transport system substrate-binding protein